MRGGAAQDSTKTVTSSPQPSPSPSVPMTNVPVAPDSTIPRARLATTSSSPAPMVPREVHGSPSTATDPPGGPQRTSGGSGSTTNVLPIAGPAMTRATATGSPDVIAASAAPIVRSSGKTG